MWEKDQAAILHRSTEFPRKRSQETLTSQLSMIFGFLGKSLEDTIPPQLFLETPAASKLILDDPWMLPDAAKIQYNIIRIHKIKGGKPANLEICKRRAPKNNRDLSGQNTLKFLGVPFGDKSDAS